MAKTGNRERRTEMRYILRNLVRIPKRSILLFSMATLVMLLSSFGIFVNTLCKEAEKRSFGPLYGYYRVSDQNGNAFLGYPQMCDIMEQSTVITDVAAVSRFKCISTNTDFYGTGQYASTRTYKSTITYMYEEETGEFVHGFSLVGVTSTDICEDFYNGTNAVIKGSGITEKDNENGLFKVVISDKVAELNGYSLGDKIEINIWSLILGYDYSHYAVEGKPEDKTYPMLEDTIADDKYISFTIGGIYRTYIENSLGCSAPFEDTANMLYVPISAVSYIETLYENTENNTECKKYMRLNDVKSEYDYSAASGRLDKAYIKLAPGTDAAELEKKLDGIGFYTSVRLIPFTSESVSLPSSRILKIVSLALYIVAVAGFSILLLIIVFGITSRKREFNCLVALGKGRFRTAASYFAEVAIIVLVAFIAASVGLGVLVILFGGGIAAYLDSADCAIVFANENASSVMRENTAVAMREKTMLDFSYLFDSYILPNVTITAIAATIMMLGMLLIIYIIIMKINALRAMGEGKL